MISWPGRPCAHCKIVVPNGVDVARMIHLEEFSGPIVVTALDKLSEGCVRTVFKKIGESRVSMENLVEVGDIIKIIDNEEYLWLKLLFDPELSSRFRSGVHTWAATMEMASALCTCHRDTRTSSLCYDHPILQQSMLVMPPRSHKGQPISPIITRCAQRLLPPAEALTD